MPTFTMLARSLGRKASAPAPSWAGQVSDLGTFAKSTSISKQLTATSAAGLALTYSVISSRPSWLTLSSTGLFSGTSTWDYIGETTATVQSFTLQVRATDTQGQYANSPILNIAVTSTVPTWATGSNLGSVNTNTSVGYNLSSSSDSGTQYYYISYNYNPGIGSISGAALAVNTPSYGTTLYWNITAVDQEYQMATQQFQLTVNAPPPTLTVNIGGYWNSGVFIQYSTQAVGTTSFGEFYGTTRPNFSIYYSSTTTIYLSFTDDPASNGTAQVTQSIIYQANGSQWSR